MPTQRLQRIVRKGDGEAIFAVEAEVELLESAGLKLQEVRRAQELAVKYHQSILDAWHDHFG